jgi:hypothetical protein
LEDNCAIFVSIVSNGFDAIGFWAIVACLAEKGGCLGVWDMKRKLTRLL